MEPPTIERPAILDPDHPSFPPGDFDFFAITPNDVREALGPDADDLLAEADVDVDELIRLINAETTVLPIIPDELSADRVGRDSLAQAELDEDEAPNRLAEAGRRWKKRFLRGAALAVLITLTGGGAAAVAMNKSVTLEVDGKEETVHTYGDTVSEVLESEGYTAGKHDALSPSPQTTVGDGGKVVLERGRLLNLTVDGEQRESWVRATNVQEALNQLGINQRGVWTSADRNAGIPLDGMSLEVKTPKHITFFDGGKEPREITTTAVTVQEFLKEQKLPLGPQDAVEKGGPQAKITDGGEIRISRTGVTVVNEKESIDPPVKEIDDPTMLEGEKKVVDPGQAGQEMVTYRITKKNNEEVGRQELNKKVLKKPKPKVVKVGTKEPPQPAISDGAIWDRLAECESSGDWSTNTGNGYYGGLQFDQSTWQAYGGDQYASLPHQASREQQIAIATKVRDARGGSYSAWPSCQSQLGLA
ncbi:MAG: DUF348 domain-containing protein [Pseudonocardiaceae bacterium]|nr:DUF348 domain-containing protein [Pseudonocardiaceae bacterium]